MANWAGVPHMVPLFTVMMYSLRSNTILLSLFCFGAIVSSVPEQLMAPIKGQ